MSYEKDIFDLGDLSDLPKELKDELVVNRRDDFELKIIELFKLAQRELSLDQVQVAYFRKYNEQKDRRQITAKLYNMARSENSAIESVKGRKGVYRLKEDFED